ncbi:MAG: acyltransferase family protein [Clostridia bacterium]|nr:acyltransferase family protein [Clostridia bacterium]
MNTIMRPVARDNFWDNLKGFLILSVVVGHLLGRFILSSEKVMALYDFINCYHIPMFVFISGIFARKARSAPEKRASKMILYYVIVQIINWAILHIFDCPTATKLTFVIPGYTFWYLVFMAVCIMLTYFMKNANPKIWIAVTCALSLASGFEQLGSEFSAARIVTFLPLFSAGYFLGTDTDKLMQTLRTTKVRIVSGILTAAIFVITFLKAADFPHAVYFGLDSYDVLYPENPFYGLIARAAFLISAAVISVFFISVFPKKKTIFSFIGENSLQIFLVHGMVLEVCWNFFNKIPFFNVSEGAGMMGQLIVVAKRYVVVGVAIILCCGIVIAIRYALRNRKTKKVN